MEQRNHDAVLVTLADRNFIDQAKQLFSSVYWNAGWKGDYMLLAHEIPEKDLKWFRDKGILVKKCKPISKVGWNEWPPTLLDKFYLFSPEFKRWKNVVFLESDIIVRASLDKLANLNGFWATSISNPSRLSNLIKSNIDTKILNELKDNFNLRKRNFNPGIMAFSSNIIQDNTFDKIISLFKHYKAISKNVEETILNLFFYKRWKKLSEVYNLCPSSLYYTYKIPYDKINGICLHFINPKSFFPNLRIDDNGKPWEKKNHFYSEWKSNLNKANKIDLNKVSDMENIGLSFRSLYLKIKIKRILFMLKSSAFYIINMPLRIMGLIGQTIKKINPRLYYFLKGKNGTKES